MKFNKDKVFGIISCFGCGCGLTSGLLFVLQLYEATVKDELLVGCISAVAACILFSISCYLINQSIFFFKKII